MACWHDTRQRCPTPAEDLPMQVPPGIGVHHAVLPGSGFTHLHRRCDAAVVRQPLGVLQEGLQLPQRRQLPRKQRLPQQRLDERAMEAAHLQRQPALSAQCWYFPHSTLLRSLHADYTTKAAASYGLLMQH